MTGNPLGTATGRIVLDPSGVRTGMEEAKRQARDGFAGFRDIFVGGMQGIGQTLTSVGTQMTAGMAPIGVAFGVATKSAVDFDETMTNVGAVLNLTSEEIDTMKVSVREFGETTRFGPQKVAEAFYDVVGGVSDASLHMAILEQSVRTAEAGNSDLGATTNALISIMNSYKLSAKDAGLASDVLTRTVGMGVGTMDDLAAAMPQVTGLAQSLNIPLDELGSMFAYLSTQGNTFSQSGTQVSNMMTALLNPNEKMKEALAAIGQTTGQAAVENLGLVGTYEALLKAGFDDEMAGLLGNTEALRGVTALTGEGVEEFFTTFEEGLDGATDAAREIQMGSAAAQIDLLKSSMGGLTEQVGEFLLPNLISFTKIGRDVIGMVSDWITKNPELVEQIIQFLGVMLAVGPTLVGAGQAMKGIGLLIGAVTSPIGLLALMVSGLFLAFKNNFFGIRDTVNSVVNFVKGIIRNDLMNELRALWDAVKSGDPNAILDAVKNLFSSINNIISFYLENSDLGSFATSVLEVWQVINQGVIDTVIPSLQLLYNWFVSDGLPAIKQGLADLGAFLADLWLSAQPHLEALVNWFTSEGMPWIQQAIQDAIATLGDFRDFLGGVWDTVAPKLQALANWFIADGIPWIKQAIADAIAAVIEFGNFLGGVWDTVAPKLQGMYTWFVETALPAIKQELAEWLPGIQEAIDILKGWWDEISPALQNIYDWFITTALPAISEAIAYFVVNYVEYLASEVSAIWETVSPWLLKFYEWFKVNGLPTIAEGITTFLENNFNPFVKAFSKLIDEAGPVLQEFKRIITTVIMPAIREALRDVGTAIQDVKDAFNRIWDSISGKVNEFKINIEKVMDAVGDAIQPIIDLIGDVISGLDKVKSAGGLLDKVGGILPFAGGGEYSAGRPRMVGEAGVEMDVPSSSGMVVSGDQLATALNVLAGGFRNVSALVGAAQQTLSAAQGDGGGGGINIGNIQIVVPEWKTENPRQAGREMGIGFEEKLKELFRGKG